MSPPVRTRRSLAQIFGVPFAMFFFTLAGLIIGLTGEGARDLLSWLLLSFPLLAAVFSWTRRG